MRKTYDGGDYKVYALDVDKKEYKDVKFSKYGNAVISGELHELGVGVPYEVEAIEEKTKHGYGYKVTNIRRDKPCSSEDMYMFLKEILTENQADVLYGTYPNIVQLVIEDKLDGIDLSRLKGIKEITFEKIKSKIVENFCLAEMVVEFQGLLSLSMVKRMYEKYTSVNMIKKKLREDPYRCLCGLARVGFSTADAILLEMERISRENIENNKKAIISFDYDLLTSEHRALSCILYLLEQNENEGHTLTDISHLRDLCIKMTPACAHHFVKCLGHDSIYYNKGTMSVALRHTYETEKYIADSIASGLTNKADVWDYDIEKHRTVDGLQLSDEQLNTLSNICKHRISILNGNAGSGKSFSIQAVINMLKGNNKSFMLLSPTGKAAKVLSEYTNEHAATIHRGLGHRPPSEWAYNIENKLTCDTLIIDEFSMSDIFLFKRVIDAIDFNKTRLLLIGDNSQLPSVACGNLLHDFMHSNVIPTTTLSEIFRYGEGGLMKVATDVRSCKQYLPSKPQKFTYFGENKDYAFIDVGAERIVESAIALYEKLIKQDTKVEDIQVLTAYRKGEYGQLALNNRIQNIANPNYGSRNHMKVGEVVYFKGDIVIQNVNNYKAKLFIGEEHTEEAETFIANGETGIVKDVFASYLLIDFDGTKVKYYRDDMSMVGLGYCITIHKSQGSTINTVILLTPQAHAYTLNSNLIYVGLTRMREKCYHLGSPHTVNTAIKKKANLNRSTFMQGLLRGSLASSK